MDVYKAVRNNVAVFINPDKFDEFWENGYVIYNVANLEDESKDIIIERGTEL